MAAQQKLELPAMSLRQYSAMSPKWTCFSRVKYDAHNIIFFNSVTRVKVNVKEGIFPEVDSERKNRLISVAKSVIQCQQFSNAD